MSKINKVADAFIGQVHRHTQDVKTVAKQLKSDLKQHGLQSLPQAGKLMQVSAKQMVRNAKVGMQHASKAAHQAQQRFESWGGFERVGHQTQAAAHKMGKLASKVANLPADLLADHMQQQRLHQRPTQPPAKPPKPPKPARPQPSRPAAQQQPQMQQPGPSLPRMSMPQPTFPSMGRPEPQMPQRRMSMPEPQLPPMGMPQPQTQPRRHSMPEPRMQMPQPRMHMPQPSVPQFGQAPRMQQTPEATRPQPRPEAAQPQPTRPAGPSLAADPSRAARELLGLNPGVLNSADVMAKATTAQAAESLRVDMQSARLQAEANFKSKLETTTNPAAREALMQAMNMLDNEFKEGEQFLGRTAFKLGITESAQRFDLDAEFMMPAKVGPKLTSREGIAQLREQVDAAEQTANKSYRKQALKAHPDKHGGDDTAFKALGKDNETLKSAIESLRNTLDEAEAKLGAAG